MSSTLRIVVPAGLLAALASMSPASASDVIVPLGISTQSVYWVGEGVNASDDGQVSGTFGTCTSAGGNSTCNIGGSFAFGGGGTYDFQLTGPSAAYPGVETAPFSQLYNFTFPNANLEFSLNFNNGMSQTYNNFYFSFSFVFPGTTCTGVGSCNGGEVGATPGATMTGPATFTLTVNSVPVPAPMVAINQVTGPSGSADQYSYQYNDLTAGGYIFIPIIDPSALVVSSLPSDVTIITSSAEIELDWPGTGNIVPYNEPAFDDPAELLEIPVTGSSLDFSFLDINLPVDGPILADGTLISDPLVPGSSAIPEPSTWAMMLIGFAGLGFAAYRRSLAAVVPAV